MPEFSQGEIKTAIAPMSNPTGKSFAYTAELYLGLPKAASSGVISFSLAAGETRNISFPVAMPTVEGTYPVYIDVYSAGQLIGAYQAIEDVAIVAPAAEFVYVSDIKRGYYSYTYDYFMVDVQNVSNIAGTCTLEFYTRVNQRVPFGWTDWVLGPTVSHILQPGEIRTFGDGKECRMRAYFRNNVLRMSVKFIGEPGEIIWEARAWA